MRDLNDEINKLIREKGHWENQIIALGGANYKRGVPKMLDDGGSEVPGTRGYKYFGRAKDLPGVKELFSRTEEQAAQAELFRSQKYKRFQNLPPSYFGDEDETPALLAWEDQQETAEWRDGVLRVRQELRLDEQREQVPPIPRKKAVSLAEIMGTPGKRKPDDQPGAKRQKADDGQAQAHAVAVAGQDKDAPHGPSSDTYKALYYSVLDPTELDMPSVPDRKATEAFILAAKKKALRDECTYPSPILPHARVCTI